MMRTRGGGGQWRQKRRRGGSPATGGGVERGGLEASSFLGLTVLCSGAAEVLSVIYIYRIEVDF